MSTIIEYAKNITPSVYKQLCTAIETGKWIDGNSLSNQQKEHTLQLLMAYQSLYNENPDHFSIAKGGEVYMQKKAELRKQFSADESTELHLIDL